MTQAGSNPVRIVVLGAGAMGSLFGAQLAAAGHDVRMVDVPGAQLHALATGGIRLSTDGGTRQVAVAATVAAEQTDPADLLMVWTKGMHTQAAAASVEHLIHSASWVVTLQNGLGNAGILRTVFPAARLAIGITSHPADLIAPGHVASHGGGTIRLWSADGQPDPAVDRLATMLTAAGLACVADPAVETAIWEKVAFNAALNALCTITRKTVGDIAGRAEARAMANAVVAETLAVAQARGVPTDPGRVAQAIASAYDAHRGHKPSMLQDLLAGRPLEVETINGAVVAFGAQAGVPTPVTGVLLGLLRVIDPGCQHAWAGGTG